MFLYQGWCLHKEKETLFLTSCMANFGLTAIFLFECRMHLPREKQPAVA